MKETTNQELIKKAASVVSPHKVSGSIRLGEVGAALVSDKGNVYCGVSIHACCGVGFCAEHSAIAAMVTQKEYKIKKIVAVGRCGKIMPPCGRCRELMFQLDRENMEADVILEEKKTIKLKELLPAPWR